MKTRLIILIGIICLLALPVQAQDVEITIARDISLAQVLPIQPGDVFHESMTVVYAVIEGDGFDEGDEIDIIWFYEGDELDSLTYEIEFDDDEFAIWTNWSAPDGMAEGEWEVIVEFDGDEIGEAEFEIIDDEYVYPVRYAEDCGRETGILINENIEFEEPTIIYAYIEYINFDEEEVNLIWMIDDDEFADAIEFEFDGDDWLCVFVRNDGDPLPEGDYSIVVTSRDGDDVFYEGAEVEIED